jgi:hypothetical protein
VAGLRGKEEDGRGRVLVDYLEVVRLMVPSLQKNEHELDMTGMNNQDMTNKIW